MDPNQENQGDSNAGENRQAIFTPQPEQPEQPEVSPNVDTPAQPSANLSHPYFSNHPTQTFNTDTGDIILNTGAPKSKQNKRPFIIGGIIIIAILVIAGIVLLAMGGFGGKKYTEEETQITNAQKAFSRYANYLLYGEEKDVLEGEYNSSTSYMLDEQLAESGASDYWNKTLELLTTATDEISKIATDNDEISAIVDALNNQYDNLDFLAFYRQIVTPSEEEIVRVYLESGAEGIKALQQQTLRPIEGMKVSAAQNYVSLIESSSENLAKELDIYNNYGCIVNSAINNDCAENALKRSSELNELNELSIETAGTAISMIRNITNQIENSCWAINNELKGVLENGK